MGKHRVRKYLPPQSVPRPRPAPLGAKLIVVHKESAQTDPAAYSSEPQTWPWPADYESLAVLAEQKNSWHTRCLAVKALAAVGAGFDLAVPKGQSDEAARAVLENLIDGDSFSAFVAFAAFTLEACGVAYIEVVRNPQGVINELYHVPPQTVWRKLDDSGYIHRAAGRADRVEFANFGEGRRTEGASLHEIVALRASTLANRHYGLPGWLPAVRAITLDDSAIDYNTAFFDNSAIPEMAIIVEGGEFTPEVEEAIKNFLARDVKGVANAHRTIYIPVPDANVKVRFEKLNLDMRDGSHHVLRMDNRDEIVAAHGVPPRVLGIMSAGQLGGGGEVAGQMQLFEQVTLRPLRDKVAKVLNKTIIADLGLPAIRFRQVDVTTWLDDVNAATALVGSAIIAPDEARADLGYEGSAPDYGDVETTQAMKALAAFEKAFG